MENRRTSTTGASTGISTATSIDSTSVPRLLTRLADGSGSAETQVRSSFGDGDTEFRSALLDGLAMRAALDCPYALATLLSLVDGHRLARSALRSVGVDENQSSDVEQAILIAVARSIHQFRGDARFTTWLFALARNVAVSEMRKSKPTTYLEDTNNLRRPAGHWSRRMSSLVAESDLIGSAIGQLSEPFRSTVYLRDVERLSYSEIAELQDLPMNTVKSRLVRGRRLLAESWHNNNGLDG